METMAEPAVNVTKERGKRAPTLTKVAPALEREYSGHHATADPCRSELG
jgi:hypothetical protein